MYKANTKHLQIALISAVSELPEKQYELLKESWAETFYQEFFCRIDEDEYAVLYSDKPSRPNIPINVMIGLEVLKAGFGWSDEEMYENYCFNLQVRHALGYDRLGDGEFAIRTIYNFRERLTKYGTEKGINLLEKTFEEITDQQIAELEVKTGIQRMDSTQIASNIVDASRMRLLVEGIQRTYRILDETDRERLKDRYEPYLKGSAGQYTYRVKGKEAVQEHLQTIGKDIHGLLCELKEGYADEKAYQVLERLFSENYKVVADEIETKEDEEIASGSLQSVDDLEASYREKCNVEYKGYVVNVTETCNPENQLQLITKVQVEPNNTDDEKMLNEALPELKKRTGLEIIYTDGGYNGEDADDTLEENEVTQIQTAIRGNQPKEDSLGLKDFHWEVGDKNVPQTVTCPNGAQATVIAGQVQGRFIAYFNIADCDRCPFADRCPAKPLKRRPKRALYFNKQDFRVARRRQISAQARASGQNLRAAVEATVRSLKHPFRNGKLPVRGLSRVSMLMVASAAMCNVRRIWRYRNQDNAKMAEKIEKCDRDSTPTTSFSSFLSPNFQFSFVFLHP